MIIQLKHLYSLLEVCSVICSDLASYDKFNKEFYTTLAKLLRQAKYITKTELYNRGDIE